MENIKGNKVKMYILIATILVILAELIIVFTFPEQVALKYYITSKVNYGSKYILMAIIFLMQCVPIAIAKFTNYLETNKKYLVTLQSILLLAIGYILIVNI